MNHSHQNGAAPEAPIRMTGAQMIWEAMAREGVHTVFGHPGGAILPAYDIFFRQAFNNPLDIGWSV